MQKPPSHSLFYSVLPCIIAILFLFPAFSAFCFEPADLAKEALIEGVTVDLREPLYENGVITTHKGGLITGPGIRVQATQIIYSHKVIEGKPHISIIAEENVMIEYGSYIFVGDHLEYDFDTKEGFVVNARSSKEPWYFGGERIDLLSDGSYALHQGFITTDDRDKTDWRIEISEATLTDNSYLAAKHIKLRFANLPVLWLPGLRADLKSLFDSPVRYFGGWGGRQGPRIGAVYEIYATEIFKMLLRAEYRARRGFRGGVETTYQNPSRTEDLYTLNYLAHDTTIIDPDLRTRYRVGGGYHRQIKNSRTSVDLIYDKLSDKDVPSDYYDRGIELQTAQKTQLSIRREDDYWISNFYSRLRINNFQTVKQELPSLATVFQPFALGKTGIISDNQFKFAYIDYKYSNEIPDVIGYNSFRCEFRDRLYRPVSLGPVIGVPEAGITAIYYNNSPVHEQQWLTLGMFGGEVYTRLFRSYGSCQHMIKPYVDYHYYTFPTVSPNEHYIFDIQDGWYRLNMMTFGVKNVVYLNNPVCRSERSINANIFGNAFFDTPTVLKVIPKIYGTLVWDPSSVQRYGIDTAWDAERSRLDHFNFRTNITVSENLAFAAEYRYRDAFCWRKADETSFILESFRSEAELANSALSDRRDTFLLHIFYRFHPDWTIEGQSHHGWHRQTQASYNEYQIDLVTRVRSAWHMKFSYQRKEEDDHRFTFSIYLDLNKPNVVCD